MKKKMMWAYLGILRFMGSAPAVYISEQVVLRGQCPAAGKPPTCSDVFIINVGVPATIAWAWLPVQTTYEQQWCMQQKMTGLVNLDLLLLSNVFVGYFCMQDIYTV